MQKKLVYAGLGLRVPEALISVPDVTSVLGNAPADHAQISGNKQLVT